MRHFPSLGLSFLSPQGGAEGTGEVSTHMGGTASWERVAWGPPRRLVAHPVWGIEKCRALAYVELGSGPMCLDSPSVLLPILWSAWGGLGGGRVGRGKQGFLTHLFVQVWTGWPVLLLWSLDFSVHFLSRFNFLFSFYCM